MGISSYNSASHLDIIPFLTDCLINTTQKKITFLNNNIHRDLTIFKFNQIFLNVDISILLEAGIFEFTLVFCSSSNIILSLYPAVYNDKVLDILSNLNEKSSVSNSFLKNAIIHQNIMPQQVAFLPPDKLFPQRWEIINRKNILRDSKKRKIASTDLYICRRCKGNRCQIRELQTRAADEPLTKFITCLDCYHVMKK